VTLDDLSNTEFFFVSLVSAGFVHFAFVLAILARGRKADGAREGQSRADEGSTYIRASFSSSGPETRKVVQSSSGAAPRAR
jgi:hypothetical protein